MQNPCTLITTQIQFLNIQINTLSNELLCDNTFIDDMQITNRHLNGVEG